MENIWREDVLNVFDSKCYQALFYYTLIFQTHPYLIIRHDNFLHSILGDKKRKKKKIKNNKKIRQKSNKSKLKSSSVWIFKMTHI